MTQPPPDSPLPSNSLVAEGPHQEPLDPVQGSILSAPKSQDIQTSLDPPCPPETPCKLYKHFSNF